MGSSVFAFGFYDGVRVAGGRRVCDSRGKLCCNISSVLDFVRVFFVENLWRSLGESLSKSCGKVSTEWQHCGFGVENGGRTRVFHGLVEKFSYEFSTRFNGGGKVVLHSFHRAYYNYYYMIRWFLVGTAERNENFRKSNS